MFEEVAEPALPQTRALSQSAAAVLQQARHEAVALHHHYIGTEHLLLGLMSADDWSGAPPFLRGWDVQTVRAQVEQLVGRGQEAPLGELPMTLRARRAFARARSEADASGMSLIEVAHLWTAIRHEGVALQVLNGMSETRPPGREGPGGCP